MVITRLAWIKQLGPMLKINRTTNCTKKSLKLLNGGNHSQTRTNIKHSSFRAKYTSCPPSRPYCYGSHPKTATSRGENSTRHYNGNHQPLSCKGQYQHYERIRTKITENSIIFDKLEAHQCEIFNYLVGFSQNKVLLIGSRTVPYYYTLKGCRT